MAQWKKKKGKYLFNKKALAKVFRVRFLAALNENRLSIPENPDGHFKIPHAGFNCRDLTSAIANKGMEPMIFPKKSNKMNGDVFWQRMYYSFYDDVVSWLIKYHQRSHTESFHSSFKRSFGIVTKLKLNAKFVQVCARIVLHNHKRLCYFGLVGD